MFLNLEDFEYVEEAPYKQEDGNDWVMIEKNDWVSSGKWEDQTCIVKNVTSGKYYEYELSRSGSYYSDYYYNHQEEGGVHLNEVVPYEETVVVVKWKYV